VLNWLNKLHDRVNDSVNSFSCFRITESQPPFKLCVQAPSEQDGGGEASDGQAAASFVNPTFKRRFWIYIITLPLPILFIIWYEHCKCWYRCHTRIQGAGRTCPLMFESLPAPWVPLYVPLYPLHVPPFRVQGRTQD